MHCKPISVIIPSVMLPKKILNLIIPESSANERLDQALAKLLPEYSRTQFQEWIEKGQVQVDGALVKAKYKLKGGEAIQIEATIKKETFWLPENISLNIVYEDDDLLIINKPIGMVVHPGAGNQTNTLLNALLHHDPALQMLPRAGIIHRLDKDTSGLLIVAKKPAALKIISHQLKKRTILREYQAIVYGKLLSGGKIDAPIDRHPLQRKRMCVSETGRPAITHYRIMEKFRAHTHLKVKLETGRTHQIRVHMAHIHHPIIGDITYGGRTKLSKGMSAEIIQLFRQFNHQALHAFKIGLIHPTTEEYIEWEIDLPNDMQHLLVALKEDSLRNKS